MVLSKDTPVLVIDDSVAIRARMESYLQRLGFNKVFTASGVEEGLKLFRESNAEVVFLDLVIDEEKGTEFASQALEERPYTHIVLMTALPSSHEYVTSAVAEGARDYLGKPIQFTTLKRILDRLRENPEDHLRPDQADASYV